MKKHKVLIIGHTYTTPVNRRKFDLMAQDKRFELLLVTPRKWRNYLTLTDNTGAPSSSECRALFVDVWFGWHHVIYLIPKLGQIIKEFQPHLIYCEQEPICLVSMQAGILSHSIPIIYFSWENVERHDFRYRLFSPVRSFCYRKSLFMTAGTREAAAVMRSHGFTKPIYITPILGVSEELFFPQNPNRLQSLMSNGQLVIGYIGRLAEQKGVSTLLQAVARIDPAVDWHLVLVGGGPEEAALEHLARQLKIRDRVTFQAPVAHDQVPSFLNGFDVLVLPSKTTATWKEQFGHVLIEAMACGVPVIGSSSGEIPRVIGEAGLISREGDAAELQEKIETLVNKPWLRRDLQKRGLKRVKERYTDARIAANMIALYEVALDLERQTPNTLEVDLG